MGRAILDGVRDVISVAVVRSAEVREVTADWCWVRHAVFLFGVDNELNCVTVVLNISCVLSLGLGGEWDAQQKKSEITK